MTQYDDLNPSYDDIHNACVVWADQTRGMPFDTIVGVARGGLIPGVIMSHQMGVPFVSIAYSSTAGAGDDRNHSNTLPDVPGEQLLIVDDICDTSLTLKEIVDHYVSKGKIVYTAVLHYKVRHDGKHIPDYYWKKIPEDSGWVVYPFERKDTL
jgi:hypoxanthine phosphoribosyltransferase